MTGPCQPRRDSLPSFGAEKRLELRNPRMKILAREVPVSDIEVGAFANAPPVAQSIGRKEQLGQLGIGCAGISGRRLGKFQLDLLCEDQRSFGPCRLQHARHRTELSSRTNENGRLDPIVDAPPVAHAFNPTHGRSEHQGRTGTFEQVVIELAATDGIAHDARKACRDPAIPERARDEAPDWLEGEAAGVRVEIEPEHVHDLRGDPARAALVPWKPGRVDDRDIRSGRAEPIRARRSGRSPADRHRIEGLHAGTWGRS